MNYKTRDDLYDFCVKVGGAESYADIGNLQGMKELADDAIEMHREVSFYKALLAPKKGDVNDPVLGQFLLILEQIILNNERAKNYLVLSFKNDKTGKEYDLTIQKREAKTPADLVAALKEAYAALRNAANALASLPLARPPLSQEAWNALCELRAVLAEKEPE